MHEEVEASRSQGQATMEDMGLGEYFCLTTPESQELCTKLGRLFEADKIETLEETLEELSESSPKSEGLRCMKELGFDKIFDFNCPEGIKLCKEMGQLFRQSKMDAIREPRSEREVPASRKGRDKRAAEEMEREDEVKQDP